MRKSRIVLLSAGLVSTIVASIFGVMIVMAQTPDFSITKTPTSLNIQQGSCATATITVTSLNGFTGVVVLTSTTTPPTPGVTETISPTAVTLTSGGSATATKTVCASASSPVECQTETITGTSDGISHPVSEQDCVTTVTPPQLFAYTAKWICFVKPPPTIPFNQNAAETIGLVPGEYKTDINIHNPSFSN